MNGFKAFKYYVAIKLHFNKPTFNVFDNRGKVKGSYEKFTSRNDHQLFERLARQFDDQSFIKYTASNFMYGDGDLHDPSEAMSNYKEFLKRKESITRVFENDMHTIINSGAKYDFAGFTIPDVLQLYLGKKITLETMVILEDLDNVVTKMRQNQSVDSLLGPELHKIQKSMKFIKYSPEKVRAVYNQLIKEVNTTNG